MDHARPAYFIAIALPSDLNELIFSFKWKLYNEIGHALKPLVPHVTLLHPSSLSGTAPENILPDISRISAPFLPMNLSLETVGSFDKGVLYIRIRSPELEALQTELVRLLPAKAQEVYRRRAYLPHVTLAQARRPNMLNIEDLARRTTEEINLPYQFITDSVSCFTQTQPRTYRAKTI